jgi:hypothetical protein
MATFPGVLHPNGSLCQSWQPSAPWWPELGLSTRLVTCSACHDIGVVADTLPEYAELLRSLGHDVEEYPDRIVITVSRS